MDWVQYFASLRADADPPPFRDTKVADFTRRIGLAALPGLDATDGVKADWRHLSIALAAEVKGLRLEWEQTIALEAGLGEGNWTWRRRDRQVSISVFVSGAGARGSRGRLVQIATETTMTDVPLMLGPAGLGDLAVQLMDGRYENVIWVFRNVCVEVDNDDTGVPILPIARRIQDFMRTHVVEGIAKHVPKVAGVDLSPNPVRVGETLTVKARLSPETPQEKLMTEIREVGDRRLFDLVEHDGLAATYTATHSGRAEFEIIVVDPKTLLSPKVGVFVDVLPAH
jgi:hypothetical protein